MTQGSKMRGGRFSGLPWVLAVLAMIAGMILFMIAGGISFDLAEVDSPTGLWAWLAGGGVLLSTAAFLSLLFLASNVVVHPSGS